MRLQKNLEHLGLGGGLTSHTFRVSRSITGGELYTGWPDYKYKNTGRIRVFFYIEKSYSVIKSKILNDTFAKRNIRKH